MVVFLRYVKQLLSVEKSNLSNLNNFLLLLLPWTVFLGTGQSQAPHKSVQSEQASQAENGNVKVVASLFINSMEK